MKESRNPFLVRASEQTESDDTFIRWFSPRVLEILEQSKESLWNKPQIFRSAPGGGKTSLMRLFSPNSLLTLCRLADRSSSNSGELFQRLKQLGVVDESGPKVLGIFLDCARGNLANLDELELERAKQNRLLLSLLNARIVLAALRGALELKGLRYPETSALEQLEVLSLPALSFVNVQLPCSGSILYEWAYDIERRICDALDSLITPKNASLPGHDSLFALEIIGASQLTHKGQPVAERVVLMLDNFHSLTQKQRRFLLREVFESRIPIGIWIAERLVALEVKDLLSDGAIQGRDYEGIYLETFWRGGNKRFEGLVRNIANCRVTETANQKIESFDLCIQNSVETDKWQSKFIEGSQVVAERIRARVSGKPDYDKWIRVTQQESLNSNSQESAISWRTLEILIERQEGKPRQLTLFNSPPLEVDELEKRNSFSVREAAELFFCQEFNIPYYYGISRLATMASSNIEQFLGLAGSLFEESLSAAFLKQRADLRPERQQQILKRAVKERWNSLPQDVQYGRDVRKFLEAIGDFSKLQTNRPSAPYVPGVTGIAIVMSDRDKLQNPTQLDKDPGLAQLSRVIKTCVAYNLLHAELDRKQGQKGGERKMLLYLNRMLCIHFDLPLGYGGWREQSLPELVAWLNFGFKPPKQLEMSL